MTLVIFWSGPAGSNMLVAGAILGAGLGLIIMGTVFVVLAVIRQGEHFTVHELGFTHSWRSTTVTAPWTDITSVTDTSKKALLAKAFGGDTACQIQVGDGRRMTINAYTEGAESLIHRVFEATGTARAE